MHPVRLIVLRTMKRARRSCQGLRVPTSNRYGRGYSSSTPSLIRKHRCRTPQQWRSPAFENTRVKLPGVEEYIFLFVTDHRQQSPDLPRSSTQNHTSGFKSTRCPDCGLFSYFPQNDKSPKGACPPKRSPLLVATTETSIFTLAFVITIKLSH